jgi:urease accessory protein
VGIARLRCRFLSGRSVVTEQYCQAPLQIHRPLYLEGGAPPVVFIKTPSSGLLDGDEHDLDVEVDSGSCLELRTQACLLVYPGVSSQNTRIRVGSGGRLVYHPHLMILGAHSDLKQTVSIELEEGSALDYCEQWCAGRIAMNEIWQFARFDYCLRVSVQGRLVYRERWCLQPGSQPLTHSVICGQNTHFKTDFIFGQARQTEGFSGAETKRWILHGAHGDIIKTASGALPKSLQHQGAKRADTLAPEDFNTKVLEPT